jgi:hemerythrin-like domain-containing protein
MINLLNKELSKITNTNKLSTDFVDVAVDFLRTYGDRCHHGKEEDILFRDLAKKQLSPDHRDIMNSLMEDHRLARQTVVKLADANKMFMQREKNAMNVVAEQLKALITLYPMHIEKEDKRFFFPCMKYFDKAEQANMLTEFWEFDRKLIHEKYEKLIEDLRKNLAF